MNGERATPLLRVIAVFKFVKALLFLAVVLGLFRMLDPAASQSAQHWIAGLALRLDRRTAQYVIAWMSGLHGNRLAVIAGIAVFYAALFTTEGVGLWMGRRWGEYLTVIATLSFVPFALYELIRRQNAPRIIALIINLAIVAYLVYRLRRDARTIALAPPPAGS